MATGSEVAQEVLDAADSVLEDAGEVVETARRFTEREIGIAFSSIGIGVSVGFVGGYLFFSKRIRTKYEKLLNEEIEDFRQHYINKAKALDERGEKPDLEAKVEELGYKTPGDPVKKTAYDKVQGSEDEAPRLAVAEVEVEREEGGEPVVVVNNVFTDTPESDGILDLNSDWDYAKEIKDRTPAVPYVIHQDEHKENDKDYEQVSLVYYEGDDILSDERDQVVTERDLVGVENLSKFGHGSGDPKIVYVRNDEKSLDFEIVHSEGKYATEVHGFTGDELQHSSMRRRSPRRSDLDDPDR